MSSTLRSWGALKLPMRPTRLTIGPRAHLCALHRAHVRRQSSAATSPGLNGPSVSTNPSIMATSMSVLTIPPIAPPASSMLGRKSPTVILFAKAPR